MENQINPTGAEEYSSFGTPPKPNNNLPLAIVSTVLGCCSPCLSGFIAGVVAIIFASQVNTKYNAQDYSGAESAAKTAKILAFVALALFLINLIYFSYLIATGKFDEMLEEIKQKLEQSR